MSSRQTPTALENYLNNALGPQLEGKIIGTLASQFTDFELDTKLKIVQRNATEYTLYPKFALSGTTDLSQPDLENEINRLYDELKIIVVDSLPPFTTIQNYHIHRFNEANQPDEV